MKYSSDLNIVSSFKEYVDNRVLVKLEAWSNDNVVLSIINGDDRMPSYDQIGGGHRQWLYDSGIVGATIADPNSFSNPDWKLAKTDFKNSRFLVSSYSGTPPSGLYLARKHFNSYVTSQDDEELFNNTDFKNTSPEIKFDSYYSPCYFVKLVSTESNPFALGGTDKIIYNFKIVCFCRSEGELLSLGSVFRDMRDKETAILLGTPLNEFNDLKTRPWSYIGAVQAAEAAANGRILIESSNFNRLKSDSLGGKVSKVYIGVANIKAFVVKNPD